MRNWLQRKKIVPIAVLPGDSITLFHRDENGDESVLASQVFTHIKAIDEVGIFTDITEDGKDMTCGAFIHANGK